MHAKLGSVQVNNPKRTQTGGFSAAQVEAHLERILASEAFKTSRRSQDFLRFVVGRVLAGQGDSIKERTIAVEAFGRPADYDSSEDSYVRVKASEVRLPGELRRKPFRGGYAADRTAFGQLCAAIRTGGRRTTGRRRG